MKLFLQVETRSSGRRQLPSQRALKASLMSAQLFCLCFSSGEEFRDGSLAACSSSLAACCPPLARTAAAARNLLLVAVRGCSSCRVASAARPQVPLALGNGIWVGGIEIEAVDDLRIEKSTS